MKKLYLNGILAVGLGPYVIDVDMPMMIGKINPF
jgi:hypothetical protein